MSSSFTVKDIQSKSILCKSGIPAMTYSINPYTGCEHACLYCYATFMKEYSRHREAWGEFVDVKANLPDLLLKEVKKKKIGRVCIGTVADPYQPIEREKKLMRNVIKILKEHNFPFHIITKSSLVTRDIDLLRGYGNSSVLITLTTVDEKVRKVFEPYADTIDNRLQALKELIRSGIETSVFFGPVLPYFSDHASAIDSIFSAFKATGVKRILIDKMNYLKSKAPVLLRAINKYFPQASGYYNYLLKSSNQYNINVKKNIYAMAEKYHLVAEVLF